VADEREKSRARVAQDIERWEKIINGEKLGVMEANDFCRTSRKEKNGERKSEFPSRVSSVMKRNRITGIASPGSSSKGGNRRPKSPWGEEERKGCILACIKKGEVTFCRLGTADSKKVSQQVLHLFWEPERSINGSCRGDIL